MLGVGRRVYTTRSVFDYGYEVQVCSGDWCWGWVGGFTQLAESLITVMRYRCFFRGIGAGGG